MIPSPCFRIVKKRQKEIRLKTRKWEECCALALAQYIAVTDHHRVNTFLCLSALVLHTTLLPKVKCDKAGICDVKPGL
jgi:hypothetical protein